MPTVIESPAPYSVHQLHIFDFVISGRKDLIMSKALEIEHKSFRNLNHRIGTGLPVQTWRFRLLVLLKAEPWLCCGL